MSEQCSKYVAICVCIYRFSTRILFFFFLNVCITMLLATYNSSHCGAPREAYWFTAPRPSIPPRPSLYHFIISQEGQSFASWMMRAQDMRYERRERKLMLPLKVQPTSATWMSVGMCTMMN